MKYFIDTEFNEDFHAPFFGRRRHFIDLISIALVAEDGREYYAISKDFDLKAAWNKMDRDGKYWLRDNVLAPIHKDLYAMETRITKEHFPNLIDFSYEGLRNLIKWHGKTNEDIKEDILDFTGTLQDIGGRTDRNPEFYGYYCDYDWVVFCTLFGKMIDLPPTYPKYCRDIKQMLDEVAERTLDTIKFKLWTHIHDCSTDSSMQNALKYLKSLAGYPRTIEHHNALGDARWTKNLYDFVNRRQHILNSN